MKVKITKQQLADAVGFTIKNCGIYIGGYDKKYELQTAVRIDDFIEVDVDAPIYSSAAPSNPNYIKKIIADNKADSDRINQIDKT
jgi:hypothetical protein